MPAQDAPLVDRIEQDLADAGQQVQRQLFVSAAAYAGRQWVLGHRGGKEGQGIQRRGTQPLTCKTAFGTAVSHRQRVVHRAGGSSEVRAARVWRAPRQVVLTQGLKDAVGDGLLEPSATGT